MCEKLAPFAMAMSTCNNEEFLSDEGLEALHQAGVQAIELSFRAAQMDKIDLTAQVEKARAHGILVWSIHLPFDGLDIAALDEAFRRRTLNYHKDLITRAGAAGIHTAVVHACLEPVADADVVRAIGDFSGTVVLFFITMLCVGTMYFLLIVQLVLVGNLTVMLR